MKSRYAVLAVVVLLSTPATAYDPATHSDISDASFKASDLNKDAKLGARLGIDIETTVFPNSRHEPRRVVQLIQFGAEFEDDRQTIQAPNHF